LVLSPPKTKILFVCAANICRSPLAEGLMRHRLRQAGLQRKVEVRSAGTHASMPGHKPDARAMRVAQKNGFNLKGIRARQIRVKDFAECELVVALDNGNLKELVRICPDEYIYKVKLLMSFAPGLGSEEVPDPYYGNYRGFEEVFGLIDSAIQRLVRKISGQ
jgi:low molecular weight protein-tyrosine phosphatase